MNSTLGIGLGVLGYFFFSLQDASNKWLVTTLPVWQVLFFRSVVILVICLAVGRRGLVERVVATPIKGSIALRAALTLVAWLCYYSAARELPLAQLLTLYFSAPLMITALAGPLLGERVTRGQWVSVAIGFAGVLVASDPFGLRATWATGLVLIAAAMWGVAMVLTRKISRREGSMVQMVATNLLFAIVTGGACVFTWVPPSRDEWVLLLGVGIFGGLGQYFTFEAVRKAQASVMATVEYSALLWAFILGFLIWHDIPRTAVWVGAGLIALAGAVLVTTERRAKKTV